MALESFLDEIAKRPDEEIALREQEYIFFQAISRITTYHQDKNQTRYEPKDSPITLEEAKKQWEPLGFKVTKAYYWNGEENPNAFWVYAKI